MRWIRMMLARWHPALRRPCALDGLDPLAIGALGENLACLALRARGCKILWRNFRGARDGEVDVVCRDGGCLVFVEVKTRTSLSHGRPSDAVTASKRHLILRGAKEWLSRLANPDVPTRMDVVEVLLFEGKAPEIQVLRDAFGDE